MKNWSRIVEDYPGNHMGPTVPFLLGAMQEPIGEIPSSETAGRAAMRRLLDALSEAPDGHGVRIQRCGTIDEYVVAQHPFSGGLDWDEIDGTKPATMNQLFERLWARYGQRILAGEFSFTDHDWYPFEPDEIAAIEASLGDR